MNEVKEPKKTGTISSGKKTAEVTFGDKKYTIHKLKAGKFYDAMQVYMDIIKEIAPSVPHVDSKKEEGIDLAKLIVSMFKTWPEKMIGFIVICCSTIDMEEKITVEFVKEEAYPEEISAAFKVCEKLNNVKDNLKNFVAPMQELGATITSQVRAKPQTKAESQK